MFQLIEEGNIPLISAVIMSNDTPRIDIVKAEPGVKYTLHRNILRVVRGIRESCGN